MRVCGDVEKLSVEESTDYFKKRPRSNQIGAFASRQTEVIPNRQVFLHIQACYKFVCVTCDFKLSDLYNFIP